MQKITTFLTFKSRGKEAVEYYISIFKDAKVNGIMVMPGSDQLLHASFSLGGQDFMAMDGGEHFTFQDGTSLFVTCKDQNEVDYYWDKLTANGGTPGRCGWLKDQFGLSWQIIPTALEELMSSTDQATSMRVRDAMLKMSKIVVAELQAAAVTA
jgi:predicted 3-demethylubiquinone-9 3-methyltransferase (glyoxalase superfamily)